LLSSSLILSTKLRLIRWWGAAEGRDGYDAVEFLAAMPWCNGSVALIGNSWLAISQYFIAAEHPPHLKCIAPLEGASDVYRENLCRGGTAQPIFAMAIAAGMFGKLAETSYTYQACMLIYASP